MSAPARGDDGPAFGSLASLGGPRKFKKKPVLVLDPEELEKAHMMFQDASAELLGEEAPRHEKGASVLGLAPMDDEDAAPEDMGASDDSEAGDDDEAIPSAEDVLRMTESRAPVDAEMDPSEDEYIAQQLESLDVDHRIFPSLPLRSEEEIAAEEAAEAAAAQASEAAENSADEEAKASQPVEKQAPTPRIDFMPDGDPEDLYISPFAIEQFGNRAEHEREEPRESSIARAFPVNPLPEPEAEIEPLPEAEPIAEVEPEVKPAPAAAMASLEDVFGTAPFLDFPSEPIHFRMEMEAEHSEAPEPEPEAEQMVEPDYPGDEQLVVEAAEQPQPQPEYQPEPEFEPQPEAELDLQVEDDWEEVAPLGLEADPEPESFDDQELAAPEASGNYTEIDDEPVDGYAFMYANNTRARTLHALAEGESNSLRAKLMKEREEAMEELGLEEHKPSIWARFTAWLRGLFVK